VHDILIQWSDGQIIVIRFNTSFINYRKIAVVMAFSAYVVFMIDRLK